MFHCAPMFVFAVYKQTGAELATEGYLMLLSPAFLRDCQEIVESLARHVTVLRPREEYPALKSAVDSGKYEIFAAMLLYNDNDETNSQTEIGNPIVEINGYSNCELLLRTFLPIPFIFHPLSDSDRIQRYFSRAISLEGAGSVETLTRLFSGNKKINFRAENGETFLHLATVTGDIALFALALQLCINIDEQDADGEAALHKAAFKGHNNLVELLLENGANVNIEDRSGSTPLVLTEHHETRFILLNFGANMENSFGMRSGKQTLLDFMRFHFEMQGQVLLDFDFNCVLKSKYPEGFSESAKRSVERQAVKLSTLGFQQPSCIADIARNATHLTERYEDEVARLKEERVGDTDITFYDIVTKGVYRNSCNVKDENFTKAVQSRDYESLFPLYATLIECEFKKGLHRRKFLDRGISAFSSLVEDSYVFPDDIKEEIIRYLTTSEILKMSENLSI